MNEIIRLGADTFKVICERCDCAFKTDKETLKLGIKCPECGADESKLNFIKERMSHKQYEYIDNDIIRMSILNDYVPDEYKVQCK